jgi:NAD-dependent SIR2 family protein deacetylase
MDTTYECIECHHRMTAAGFLANESPECPQCEGDMLPEELVR